MLGASGVQTGKYIMQAAAGCLGSEADRCNVCNTGVCPQGIPSPDPRRDRRRIRKRLLSAWWSVSEFRYGIEEIVAPLGLRRRCRSACRMRWESATRMRPSG
jgi:glutamate synthase (NADPH/NADH) large chain